MLFFEIHTSFDSFFHNFLKLQTPRAPLDTKCFCRTTREKHRILPQNEINQSVFIKFHITYGRVTTAIIESRLSVCHLSPLKRRHIRWQNLACGRVCVTYGLGLMSIGVTVGKKIKTLKHCVKCVCTFAAVAAMGGRTPATSSKAVTVPHPAGLHVTQIEARTGRELS